MPNKTDKTASFAQMIKAALGGDLIDGVQSTREGGSFRLPLTRLAVIEADAVAGRERVVDGVSWLAGDAADSPILSRLNIIATPVTRGKVSSGAVLPQTSMQGQSGSAALGRGAAFPTVPAPEIGDRYTFLSDTAGITALESDGVTALTAATRDQSFRYDGAAWVAQASLFGEHDYDLSSTIEAKSEISLQLAVQTADTVLDDVLEAHRLGIQDRLLEQILSGDGTGNNLSGVASATGIGAGSYPLADRGSDEFFTDAEIAVEDGGGRSQFMSWALGTNLDTSARKTAVEPGASRRVLEMGRLTLSGLPAQRIVEGLTATSGLIADWQTVTVPILDELIIVIDRVSVPGEVRITSRLSVADPITTHPSTIYKLEQA